MVVSLWDKFKNNGGKSVPGGQFSLQQVTNINKIFIVIMTLLSKEEMYEVFSRFERQNPMPVSELNYINAYTLLVAVVLSAQATDKSVNIATKPLFALVDSPEKMIKLGEEQLITYIKSIGLYRNKAKNIIKLSNMLITDFNSKVPDNMEDLLKLPGVGRKTSNVVLNVVFNKPTMPVDTHLLRISPKIGLAKGNTPEQIEQSLLERIPDVFLQNAHHWILLHGRYVCTAKKTKCDVCIIKDICKHND